MKLDPNILEAPFNPDLLPSVTEAGQIMRSTGVTTVMNVGIWGDNLLMNYTPTLGIDARSRFMEICAVIWCAGRHYGLNER